MKTGIIFDGEDEQVLTFDQIKEIGKESPITLVQLFQSTAVFRDVMKDLIKEHGKEILKTDDGELADVRIKLVETGYNLLVEELIDILGEDKALMVVAGAHNAINLEKQDGRG
jgi:hypothetical protein